MKSLNKSTRYRNRQKLKAVEYLGGKCSRCGYNKSVAALDFHHLDKSEKEWNPSRMMAYRWEVILKELNKCILLCANCHREEHEGVTEFELQRQPNGQRVFHKNVCHQCNNEFSTLKIRQKYCSRICFSLHNMRLEKTLYETVLDLKNNNSIDDLSIKFNVNKELILKWFQLYNVELVSELVS